MNFKRSFFCIVLLFSLSNYVGAGSKNLFRDGESGFDFCGFYSSSTNVNTLGLGAFYSFYSFLDFGVNIGRATFDESETLIALNMTGIAPFLGLQILKQSQTIPVSLTIRGGYEIDTYSGDILRENELKMRASALGINGNIYGDIEISPQVSLVPSIGISYINGTVKMEDNYNNETTESVSNTTYNISLGFKFKIGNNNFLYLDPLLSIDEGESAFGISLGFGIPLNADNYKKNINETVEGHVNSPLLSLQGHYNSPLFWLSGSS